jgi:hypothetical protein
VGGERIGLVPDGVAISADGIFRVSHRGLTANQDKKSIISVQRSVRPMPRGCVSSGSLNR